jgi:hypothetical protein
LDITQIAGEKDEPASIPRQLIDKSKMLFQTHSFRHSIQHITLDSNHFDQEACHLRENSLLYGAL